MEEVGDAIKSIPSQVADFAKGPLKGGFVAKLVSIPLGAAAIGPAAEAAPMAAAAAGEVVSGAANAVELAAIRAQVTALQNPVGSYLIGFGLGVNGLPAPQGFGAVKLGLRTVR